MSSHQKKEPLPPRTSAETYKIMAQIFAGIAVVVVVIMIVVSEHKRTHEQDCARNDAIVTAGGTAATC
jgi:hypothetical protein